MNNKQTGPTNYPGNTKKTPSGQPGGGRNWNLPTGNIWFVLLGILALNYFLGKFFYPDPETPAKISYTLFKEEVRKKNVKEIYSKGLSLTGSFIEPVKLPKIGKEQLDTLNAEEKEELEAKVVEA